MNYKRIKKQFKSHKNISKLTSLVLAGLLTVSLAACTSTSAGESSTGQAETSAASTDLTSSGSADTNASAEVTSVAYVDTSDLFTDRDLDPSYEEADSVSIILSDSGTTCKSKAVSIDGRTITISDKGIYVISGSLSDGQIIIDADDEKVQLILNGVSISSSSSAAIYVKQADKVFITLSEGTENILSTTGEYVAIDDNSIDAVIYSKDDLVLNGEGILNISNGYGHGIVSKDDLKITSGSYNITASSCGLSGKDSLLIADGTFVIEAGTDCLHSSNDEDESLGSIVIENGSFTLSAGSDAIDGSGTVQIDNGSFVISAEDDAVHSDTTTIIKGGNIFVSKCYEGLEGNAVIINDGVINITATDDGINAAGGNDNSGFGPSGGKDSFRSDSSASYIQINGGNITINSSGDGVDANGSLYVTGGYTFVNGSTDNGNGALDYDTNGVISGGTFIALGASGMAMNFSESSQGSILVNLSSSYSASDQITLSDESGNEIISITAAKKGNSVLISSPDITSDGKYTLTAGDTSTQISMDGSNIYGSVFSFGGGGFGGGPGGNFGSGFGGDTNGRPGGGFGGNPPDGFENFDGERPDFPDNFDGEKPDFPDNFDGEKPDFSTDFNGDKFDFSNGFNGEKPEFPDDSNDK